MASSAGQGKPWHCMAIAGATGLARALGKAWQGSWPLGQAAGPYKGKLGFIRGLA